MSEVNRELNLFSTENGDVVFSPDVIATIAGIAAMEVEGVAGMSGGITDGIVQILGIKNFKKGVKAEVTSNRASVSASIVVKYDFNIPKVAAKVQEAIHSEIESMTGLDVEQVNVYVQGVSFDTEKLKKRA